MDMVNYLHNQLSIRPESLIFISKETRTNIKQNLKHIRIFGNRMSTFILSEKRTKSNIRKS